MQFALLKTGFQRQKPQHFMPPPLCIDQAIAKDHIAATFAIDGRAKRRMMRKRGFELCGRGQLSGVEFRNSRRAGKIYCAALGAGSSGSGEKKDSCAPGVSPAFHLMRIAKRKSAVRGNGDMLCRWPGQGGLGRQGRSAELSKRREI